MALSFPATPADGDVYTAEGVAFTWDDTNQLWVGGQQPPADFITSPADAAGALVNDGAGNLAWTQVFTPPAPPSNKEAFLGVDDTGAYQWNDPTTDLITQRPAAGVSQTIQVNDPADIGLTVQAAPGQTADLFRVETESGGNAFSINYAGSLQAGERALDFSTTGFLLSSGGYFSISAQGQGEFAFWRSATHPVLDINATGKASQSGIQLTMSDGYSGNALQIRTVSTGLRCRIGFSQNRKGRNERSRPLEGPATPHGYRLGDHQREGGLVPPLRPPERGRRLVDPGPLRSRHRDRVRRPVRACSGMPELRQGDHLSRSHDEALHGRSESSGRREISLRLLPRLDREREDW